MIKNQLFAAGIPGNSPMRLADSIGGEVIYFWSHRSSGDCVCIRTCKGLVRQVSTDSSNRFRLYPEQSRGLRVNVIQL